VDKPSLLDRARYFFDNTMSRGPIALIGWLALLSAVVILLVAVFVWTVGIAAEATLGDQVWAYLMHALGDYDPMSGASWSFRLSTLVVTFTGIFVMSTLIGVLTAGIEGKLDDLRKGRSKVIESGHTVILGWSPQVFNIISELVIANESQPKSCIVILGDRDKVEMEDEIRDKVGSTGRTRIVCRTGSPVDMGDLELVSLQTAKSIIALAPEGADPDVGVIKTLLAITKNPQRRPEPYHIVAEIHNPRNLAVARMIGQAEAELVFTGDLVARITAQTCRQSGLSVVYTELMNFEGDEIYFREEPALVGKTFGEALSAYEDSIVIGLCFQGGRVKLNPPMDTVIQAGDQVIAISEDEGTVVLSGMADLGIDETAICTLRPAERVPEQVLILGWNWRAPAIIGELDSYVAPGSTVTVVADCAGCEAELARCCGNLQNLIFDVQRGDITDRNLLDSLPFDEIDHVILLSRLDLEPQLADARTLVTLLHLRDIAGHLGRSFSIVSEMMDVRNQQLAEVTRADDFVISDKLVSLILSQISENKALGAVFEDLFDPEGVEIYLKPAAEYVELGRSVSFYTVVEAACRHGEVALGYRLHVLSGDAARAYGVAINPDKSLPVAFAEQDKVIVLAED
jgi:voltage-gated potassium channel Kch